jgi:predicted GIY-YIG superfamily endonuclease
MLPKRTVYVLKSIDAPTRYYTGVTSDVPARLKAHNAGRCPHTAAGRRGKWM